MKKQYCITIVFALAIGIFFGCKTDKPEQNTSSEQSAASATDSSSNTIGAQQFPIAYVAVDSIMRNYEYATQRNKDYTAAFEREASKLQAQMSKIQQDMQNLQLQHQQGLITTRNAEAKGAELQKRYESFMQTQQKKELEFQQTEMAILTELQDSLNVAIKLVNHDNRFTIVLNNAAILYAEEQLNITEPVLKLLNERYKKSITK
ncbi:MAG: OmpH family outer membrane protein [Bacteroidales bacterium]|jgi:Skp family chaperone for outer membrane proteins|nr:OmpH family outer membrane protein [Bacteroidales bacterium]